MPSKTCIIICGPTASGKTDVAIQVAQYFNTQIISADSRQCFTALNIGVAKPSPEQLAAVPHYFINSHSIQETVTAADFENYALAKIERIFEQNQVAVMCGGTGLYIKAFTNGLDAIAPINENVKNEIATTYAENGINWLQQQIQLEDPLFFTNGEMQNPHRLLRALEVIRSTGKSILAQQTNTKKQHPFNIITIGIDIERQILYDRINKRVDNMRADGLEDEAKNLFQYKTLNALQTVGYSEMFDYFDGNITLQKAIDLIKQNTRHYAKRQVTWFKKVDDIIWLKTEEVISFVKKLKL